MAAQLLLDSLCVTLEEHCTKQSEEVAAPGCGNKRHFAHLKEHPICYADILTTKTTLDLSPFTHQLHTIDTFTRF